MSFVMKSVEISTATTLCFIAWQQRVSGETVVSLSLNQETGMLGALHNANQFAFFNQVNKVNDLHTSQVVTKSCRINTTGGESNNQGFLLVLLFFFFPMKVARDHIHRSRGKSLAAALNDRPVISCQRFYWSFCFFLNYASTSCASFYDA